jgi:hypothetical protein
MTTEVPLAALHGFSFLIRRTEPGSWVTKTVDSSGNADPETALAVDSNNEAHILYQHYYSTKYLEYYFE